MARIVQKKEIVSKVVLFLLKFNLLLIPFYAIIYFNLSVHPLQVVFANFITSILRLLNYPVRTNEFYLFIGREEFPIEISMDCLGWKGVYSLFALIFATAGKIKDKLRFLVVWAPILFVINILRVLFTMIFGLNFGMQYIEFIHSFLWQEVMIAALIVIFYIWLKKGKIK